MKDYVQLALDLSKGKTPQNFSKDQSNTVLRKAFLEEIGTETIDYNTYRENKYKIFRIIQEVITPIINQRVENIVGDFAEIRNVAFGDSIAFEVDNPALFEVAIVADGNANLTRQRIDNRRFPVETKTYGVKVYDEFYRFLAGRVDWDKVIEKVATSYEKKIANAVSTALFGGYTSLATELRYSGSYDEAELLRVAQTVEALYGSAVIVGTKAALGVIQPTYVGNADKERYNQLGQIGIYRGYPTLELAQSVAPGTFTFEVPNTSLLVLPSSGEKIVKIVLEGTAIVNDFENSQGDMSIEHLFIQKAGVAVPVANAFGIVEFTN